MAMHPILKEFLSEHPGKLQQELAECFSTLIQEPDEKISESLKQVLDNLLEQRIHAIDEH